MPCMYKGQPVKGNKGSCPYGSTWAEPQAQAPADNRNMLQQGIGYAKENPLEALSYGALAIPGIGLPAAGAIRGAGLLYKGAKMKGGIGKLMDRIFRKEGTPATLGNPGFVLPKGVSTQSRATGTRGGVARQTANTTPLTGGASPGTAASRIMKRPSKVGGGATALGLGGLGGLYASGADERASNLQALQQQQQQQAGTALDANTKALMDANAAKAEADRVAGLNPLEAMMENMKKPGYWTDPMNEGGPASDNRLNRMGQLMNYYGSTPKQRATMDSPQKTFLATEQQLADNQAAFLKAQQTLSSKYGKPTVSNLATGMYDMVEEAYGDTWMPFDEKGEDELKRISTMAANIFVELSQDPRFAGASEDALRQEAVIRAGEELQL